MTQRQRRLGRGLGALLPTAEADSGTELNARFVDVGSIRPNRYQPRTVMDPDALQELTDSIATHGVLEPIIVRPDGDGFELVVGERRWRAAQAAGLDEIPAVVRELSDEEAAIIALVENLQREDLNPIEEAQAYKRLLDLNLTQEEVATQVGRSRSAVANSLRLLTLDAGMQSLIAQGRLSVGHAKVLLSVTGGAERQRLLTHVLQEGLTVRQTEQLVRATPAERPERPRRAQRRGTATERDIGTHMWTDVEEQLSEHLSTRVRVVPQGDGGRIVIEFFSVEDATRLLDLIVPRGT